MARASKAFRRSAPTFSQFAARWVGVVITPALAPQFEADRARVLGAESDAERPRRNWDGRGEFARPRGRR